MIQSKRMDGRTHGKWIDGWMVVYMVGGWMVGCRIHGRWMDGWMSDTW